jgi:hypothetical protein
LESKALTPGFGRYKQLHIFAVVDNDCQSTLLADEAYYCSTYRLKLVLQWDKLWCVLIFLSSNL